jgi:hypothetical protein
LEQLADDEIATIYASQLGHIVHWDFAAHVPSNSCNWSCHIRSIVKCLSGETQEQIQFYA